MLVIKVELWPKGDESRAREIGRGLIANVGGDAQTGHYEVRLLKSAEYSRNPGDVWKRGRVQGFPRLVLGPWDLLLRGLVAACGRRSRHEAAAVEVGVIAPAGAPFAAQDQHDLHSVIDPDPGLFREARRG